MIHLVNDWEAVIWRTQNPKWDKQQQRTSKNFVAKKFSNKWTEKMEKQINM